MWLIFKTKVLTYLSKANSDSKFCLVNSHIFKGAFRENQMHAKVYIVIPIEKQIFSALRNRFPFLDRTSQRQDMEKNIGPISILIPYYFCAPLLAKKGCKFSLLPAG